MILRMARISPKFGFIISLILTGYFLFVAPLNFGAGALGLLTTFITYVMTPIKEQQVIETDTPQRIAELRQWESERPKVTKYIPYIDSHYNHESWCECNHCKCSPSFCTVCNKVVARKHRLSDHLQNRWC